MCVFFVQVNVDDLYRLQGLSQKQMEAGRKLNIFTPYNVPEEEVMNLFFVLFCFKGVLHFKFNFLFFPNI
jgi:hypothetical protein